MKPLDKITAVVAPLDRANVDTDAIMPKQFLKSIKRTGFGAYLFDEWRFLDPGTLDKTIDDRTPNPDFVLNQKPYDSAQILLAQSNFGCGSSREHAPWALADFGFRVIIAPSYADIFFNNCFKNGILPIVLNDEIVDQLFTEMYAEEGYTLSVDLEAQTVVTPKGESFSFDVDSFRKYCLLNGLDDIGLTLQDADDIRAFESKWQQQSPWLFQNITP